MECPVCQEDRSHFLCASCAKRKVEQKRDALRGTWTGAAAYDQKLSAALKQALVPTLPAASSSGAAAGGANGSGSSSGSEVGRALAHALSVARQHRLAAMLVSGERHAARERLRLQHARTELAARVQRLHDIVAQVHTGRTSLAAAAPARHTKLTHRLAEIEALTTKQSKRVVNDLLALYPIRVKDADRCSIAGIPLANDAAAIAHAAAAYADSVATAPRAAPAVSAAYDPHATPAALGYVVLVLQYLAGYLDVILPYEMRFFGAHSYLYVREQFAPNAHADAAQTPTSPGPPVRSPAPVLSPNGPALPGHRHSLTSGNGSGGSSAAHAATAAGAMPHSTRSHGAFSFTEPAAHKKYLTVTADAHSGSGSGAGGVGVSAESFRIALYYLDTNIRHLCLRQGVEAVHLKEHHLLHNLLTLIDSVHINYRKNLKKKPQPQPQPQQPQPHPRPPTPTQPPQPPPQPPKTPPPQPAAPSSPAAPATVQPASGAAAAGGGGGWFGALTSLWSKPAAPTVGAGGMALGSGIGAHQRRPSFADTASMDGLTDDPLLGDPDAADSELDEDIVIVHGED